VQENAFGWINAQTVKELGMLEGKLSSVAA
jgi:hypothetical protein